MSRSTDTKSEGYGIRTVPLVGRVTAVRDGAVLASSTSAKVMYETRLPPVVYFPQEDVLADLGPQTELQTFCPFKGTARYRDLTIDGQSFPNAVWSYDDALPESRGIEGHLGFMPTVGAEIDIGENRLEPDRSGHISGQLTDWLLREAAYIGSPEELTTALCERLSDQGIRLSRLSVMIWSLHPLIAGKNYVWDKATGKVTTFAPSYEIYDHPGFVNSPLRHVSEGLGGIRQKLGEKIAENSFPILQDLQDRGATDYVAMPLPFSNGQMNVLTLASDHPDGFTTANLGLVFECASTISRFYEVFTQRENARSLLETYVGKRSGARVLGGEIRRGDGDKIDAAIMFCDMRDSTRLAESLERDVYLDLLNHFFETVSTLADAHGGEVLKFIGDAVLAVFPAGDDAEAACAQAIEAARAIVAALDQPRGADTPTCSSAIGIDFGSVLYGNVGSRERLDFTVIGHAANVAARLCDRGKMTEHAIVATERVVGKDARVTPLGAVDLRNVSATVNAFSIAP
ncbi:DUF427 domain-containing protein [Marimonas sp. MJW-29]|uniref:DUF427 domain-containing protein n=1 Tax=Sulfitobacter sediminis TaxID=3234186 RepID=A0ABV3RPU0_9RHOB